MPDLKRGDTSAPQFTQRSPGLQQFCNELAKEFFGADAKLDGSACVCCKSTAVTRSDFKDELSWREFHISLLCQNCQDATFDVEETEE